ncbi:MAG: amidinotransferase [Chloroflexi bacterium]|nr:amidinotransferase [Chloroflexota bacterium]
MCPPDFYGIQYEINPWMDRRRGADQARAREQWDHLRRVLTEDAGAAVELATPRAGLPDMVFTANAGYCEGGLVILSRFRYSERAGEEAPFQRWFRGHGFQVALLPEGMYFEGEGDLLPCGEALCGGYRYRSDIRSHLAVSELIGREVLSLELVDPRFYHLDTCFCPLDSGSAVYYPGAFDRYGRRVLRALVPDLIAAPRKEALRFGCNAIVVGRRVVMNTGCPSLRRELEDRGYAVHEVELSEYIKAGGSAKCLTMFLDRPGLHQETRSQST